MVLYSFMNKIAPEPHAWSTSPATSLKNYLKRYGSVYSEQEEVTPTTAPVGSCGNGVCEEGETVSNCPVLGTEQRRALLPVELLQSVLHLSEQPSVRTDDAALQLAVLRREPDQLDGQSVCERVLSERDSPVLW